MNAILRAACAVFLLAVLQACGGGDKDNSPPASGGGGGGTTADTTAPTVPAGLTATAQSATQVQLSWTAATDGGTGVAGYHVYRDAGTTAIATVTSGTAYTDTGLTAATAYTYTVRAFDGATPPNESAASAAASATTMAATAPVTSGLDARPSNTSCLAGDAPADTVALGLDQVFAGVSPFTVPILMLQAPGSTANWYVVQKTGAVYAFANQPSVSTKRVFIDVSSQIAVNASDPNDERGLLGMAFHPNFPTNPRVYLSYTATAGSQLVSRVVEYQTHDGGQTLDASSGVVILQVNQPETNHNGGNIAFGPDGFLYIGLGDGGGGNDAHGTTGNGQRLSTLLGKILRIDVNGAAPYAIPAGNPYAGGAVCNNDAGAFTANCPEIYAYGFRNPWRWSFDSGSGELWVGDVGQNTWEEVDRVTLGGNYGWRCREGAHDFNLTCGANAASALDPIAEYSHSFGIAVTGGYVYRGSAVPELAGRYVFGDFGSGRIWTVPRDAMATQEVTSGLDTGLSIASFAQDAGGEIYVVHLGGTLHKLRAGTTTGRVIPTLLSATGCVSPTDPTQPASGLIPYAPNAPFWSDGAVKTRFLALPEGQKISVAQDGDFDLPIGSVLMKNFRIGTQLVETRLLVRHNNGQWGGYTYEWNAQGTDATRVVGGKAVHVAGQDWLFPSETKCAFCHSSPAGHSLGLEIAQLNGSFTYAATGRTANQLDTLSTIGTLSAPLSAPPAQLPALPDPYGTAGTLTERARSYLHTNCSHCHRPNGPTPVDMDLRYTTPLADTHACNVVPTRGDLGIGATARRIAVGGGDAASRSLIVARPSRTDSNSMPPLQPRVVDAAGVALLTSWVNSLTACN